MAYVSKEMKEKLAPKIKAICKKYGVKATIAVHNHSTLVLNIASAKIDFLGNYNEVAAKRPGFAERGGYVVTTDLQVNPYCTDECFSGKAAKFFAELIPAMKGPDYFDHSDSQTDYFHTSHYLSINIGRWNRPFVHTK